MGRYFVENVVIFFVLHNGTVNFLEGQGYSNSFLEAIASLAIQNWAEIKFYQMGNTQFFGAASVLVFQN